jgi:hypothetical protein
VNFFSIPNWTRLEAVEVQEPWTLPPFEWPAGATKDQFRAICSNSETRHHFISAFEGLTKTIRIAKDTANPPYQMWGLIGDYDTPVTEETFAKLIADPQGDYPPAWGVLTFSGRARLIWIFEAPIRLSNSAQITK